MNVIDRYTRDVLVSGQRRPRTLASAANTFHHFDTWRAEAGKGAPETLTRADMREWKVWLLERFNTNTARLHWIRTQALYKYLLVEEAIDKDPMLGIELPKQKQRPPRVYTADDLRRMMSACESNLDRVVLYSFIFTGMREGEVEAMAWHPAPSDEDETRSFVDFEKDALVITSAKQDKSRNVPLHPLLCAELQQARTGFPIEEWFGDVWVFGSKQIVRRVMRRLLKASVTPGAEHQFRATALTYWDEHGISDSVRHSIVGHTAKGVEAKHYLAVKDERKIAAIRSLYAGELPGCEAPTVLHKNGNGGLDMSGLTTEQRVAVEGMIAAFREKEAVTA